MVNDKSQQHMSETVR